MLSIIIPTLNEEKYLPRLLESIKEQSFNDYELIIADAGSNDRTIEIAEKYGCIIVEGGLPAQAKNRGAEKAHGDIFLFLDADVILSRNFLEYSLKEFRKRRLGIASYVLRTERPQRLAQFNLDFFYNQPIKVLEKILPHGAMGILVEKSIFKRVKGFDQEIKLGEDHNFVRKAAKLAEFGVIRSAKISISLRRFEQDGWIRTGLKYFLCGLHMIFLGPVKSDIFRYRFNHYTSKEK